MSSPIDPRLLLKVLEPILDLYGGVKSTQIANRFVNVMRDARKLVHRCVYLNILKATRTQDIRKQILTLGAWNILYDWLKDAERDKHWNVINELLELYLELPVTIDLLKLNNTPKLIRQLSKRTDLDPELKHLAADIVLIWKDIIVGESSNDLQTTNNNNNNNNNSFSVVLGNISQVPGKTMMKQIDPNIDIEESEDSSSNHTLIHHSPITSSYAMSKPMSTNILNSPGNVFEKLKPADLKNSFSAAISSADKSLSDSNKRPKITTKSYPSKFRSGFDAEPEPPIKKPKPSTIPTTPKVTVADVIKANAAKRQNDDGVARLKTYADKKLKPSPPVLLDSLLPPLEHSQTPSTSGPTTVTSPVLTTPPAVPKPKIAQPKAVQLIESSSFMAALEGTAAQKASLIRKKKIVPKTTNVASTNMAPNKNDLLIAKPQFYKEIGKSSQVESSPPTSLQANREGKKRVRWAGDNELVQIQYFEIDETERINVNRIKAWGDLKHFEMHREREFMEAAKKHRYQETNTEEVYFPWRLIKFDGLSDLNERGKESQEKSIQAERQKNILAEVYLPGMPLPDSPKEPDLTDRIAQHELILIPLDEAGTTTTVTQLPPELKNLLEGLKQNGLMPNTNLMGQGSVGNMPSNIMPPNMMQQPMRPPPNMPPPPMMNGPGGPMMPPNAFVPPPNMGGPNAPPNMMMYPPNHPNMMPNQLPRSQGPPMYGVNMNGPPRNAWGPMNSGPPPIRQPGASPMNKPPFQNRPPFRGGRPSGVPRAPYKNYNKSCPYFEQGRCTFGDQCRYMHIKRNDHAHHDSERSHHDSERLHHDSERLSPDYTKGSSSPNDSPSNDKASPKDDTDLRNSSQLTPMSPE